MTADRSVTGTGQCACMLSAQRTASLTPPPDLLRPWRLQENRSPLKTAETPPLLVSSSYLNTFFSVVIEVRRHTSSPRGSTDLWFAFHGGKRRENWPELERDIASQSTCWCLCQGLSPRAALSPQGVFGNVLSVRWVDRRPFPFSFIRLYFSEQFLDPSKTQWKVQRIPICPLPAHMHRLSSITSSADGAFVTVDVPDPGL